MQLKNQRFIDLFAGIGGFHQALNQFGAECVFASEWDKFSSETYYVNYGIKPVGDITQIDEKNIPEHDILCAGFPCQAFSIAGKQQGFDDIRGTLFFDIVRIAKYHQPKVLFLENVKNLVKHNNGNTLKVILNYLENINYNVFYQVLNASSFSLPQNRERIYIVAFRKDLHITNFKFPIGRNQPIALNDILDIHQTEIKSIQRDDIIIDKVYEPKMDLFGQVIYPNKPIQIGIVNKGGQGERIYHIHGHAITLSAHGGGVGAKTGLYQIGNSIRKLTPRECARLQGFPESFKIISSTAQAYKQFGNSVAINVLVDILKQIEMLNMEQIMNFNEKQQIGSKTAKGGFANEHEIVKKFENYLTDDEVQQWLNIMGYDYLKINKLVAVHIPTRLNRNKMEVFGISDEQFEFTQRFKKADVQIQLTIMIDDMIYVENISLKKADLKSNFNQVDKRPVKIYQEMWHFDDDIAEILKQFTGEIQPTKEQAIKLRDKRRWYLDELPHEKVEKLLKFMNENKYLIVSDILKGRGMLSAEWFLVTRLNPDGSKDWILKNINEVINFYAQDNAKMNENGNLVIGQLTAQRKGGTPDPTSLQFKIKPLALFEM